MLADKQGAGGLGINMNAGRDKVEDAFDAFIKQGESDFEGWRLDSDLGSELS